MRRLEFLPWWEANAVHILSKLPQNSFQSASDANLIIADLVCTFSQQYFRGQETVLRAEGD